MVTVSGRKPVFFNEPIQIVIPGTSGRARALHLQIEERHADGETQYGVELRDEEDLAFVYSEAITRSKYKALADRYSIDVSFDNFFDGLKPFLESGEKRCTFSDDKKLCTLEFSLKKEFYSVRFSMELTRIEGEALLSHLMNTIRRLKEKLRASQLIKSDLASLKKTHDSVVEQRNAMEEENEKLKTQITSLKDEIETLEDRVMDFTNKLDRCRFELETAQEDLAELEDIRGDWEAAEEECGSLINERDRLLEENNSYSRRIEELERKLRQSRDEYEALRRDHDKSKYILGKYFNNRTPTQTPERISCSTSKLEELQADIKDKNELLDTLKSNIGVLEKKLTEKDSEISVLKYQLGEAHNNIKETELRCRQKYLSPLHYNISPAFTRTAPLQPVQRRVPGFTPTPYVPGTPMASTIGRPPEMGLLQRLQLGNGATTSLTPRHPGIDPSPK